MYLSHPDLENFEPFLRDLLDTAFNTGGKYLKDNGITLDDIKLFLKDKSQNKEFIKQCHKGYNWAQEKIGNKIISLQELKLSLVERKSTASQSSISEIGTQILIIENRTLVLRRIIDSIGYTLLNRKQWIMRRFILHSLSTSNINCNEIKANLREASFRNNTDRQVFNLACDLSNIFHVGDLLKIDFRKHPPKWEIIELKKGHINNELRKIINDHPDSAKVVTPSAKLTLDDKTSKQLNRMRRQIARMRNIENIYSTDQGVDTTSGCKLFLNKEEIPLDHYYEVLEKAVSNAHNKGSSLHQIDDCLFILASKEHSAFQIKHILFHLTNPFSQCHFESRDIDNSNIRNEIKAVSKDWFIADFIKGSIHTMGCEPTFTLPINHEIILDLLFERVKVGIGIAVEPFIELLNKNGVNARLGTRKETGDHLHTRGNIETLLYKKRIIICNMLNGYEFVLGTGILSRMLFDLVRPGIIPSVFIEAHRQYDEQGTFNQGGAGTL